MTTLPIDRCSGGATMSIVGHLTELRRRLIISIAAVAVAAVVVFIFSNQIIGLLVDFYRDATGGKRDALVFTGPLDAFATRLKVASYGGIAVAFPVWIWQLRSLVTPGL